MVLHMPVVRNRTRLEVAKIMRVNPDFWRGFWIALGVAGGLYVFGTATGVLKKVF